MPRSLQSNLYFPASFVFHGQRCRRSGRSSNTSHPDHGVPLHHARYPLQSRHPPRAHLWQTHRRPRTPQTPPQSRRTIAPLHKLHDGLELERFWCVWGIRSWTLSSGLVSVACLRGRRSGRTRCSRRLFTRALGDRWEITTCRIGLDCRP